MTRIVLAIFAAAALIACREQPSVTAPRPTLPEALISDGHSGGNPHFFFLPPILPKPSPNGPFNARLAPVVEICSVLEAPCASGHVLAALGPVVVDGPEQYHVNWDTGPLQLSIGTKVRIIVRVGTRHILGFADVDLVANTSMKNLQTTADIQLVDGRTLPIAFRIEQGALTPDQACTDCVEQSISTSTGSATVVTNTQLAGAFFPQGALPQDVTVIIEATPPAAGQSCIPVSLDQFPGCYTFATDPGPTTFNTAVTAGICVETDGLTSDEIKSLILYQLDVVTSGELTANVVTPLENAPAAFLPCNALAAERGSRGLLARARDALVRLLVPPPLNAAHVGVGGLAGSFSKIGWGRPPTMSKVAGTDGESAPAGTAVAAPPGVQLTNSHGKPVPGLPITFTVASGGGSITVPGGEVGTAGPVIVRTGNDGVAALASWTLGSSPGANTLTASQIGALGSPLTFSATGTPPGFVFVANRLSNSVSGYAIDAATGSLTPIPGSPFATGLHPVAVAADPSGRFLAVANMGDPPSATFGNLSAYLIDPVTGVLTPVDGSPFATSLFPEGVTVHPTGKFVYVANAGVVPAFSVDPGSGVLSPLPGSPFFTSGSGPDNVGIDPAGKFAYVPNLASANVTGFTIDAASGVLTELPSSPFPTGTEPAEVVVTPSGRFAYVMNHGASTVSAYSIDGTTGALTSIADPVAVGGAPTSLAVHPTGKFLYVACEAAALSSFAIDPTTGALTPLAGSPFDVGPVPFGVAIDLSGTFMYVSNRTAGTVSGFRIDRATGALAAVPGSPFAAGQDASNVAIAPSLTR